MNLRDRLEEARQHRAWRLARKPLAVVVLLAAFVAFEWFLVLWVGVIDALIYTVLFAVGVAFFPFWIAIAGADLPYNGTIGRWHILLGAIAFNHHYLVDMGDGWQWCPGDEEGVYVDGEYHEIDGGFENRSVLGWRPFGILRYKDEDAYHELRVDTAAEHRRGTAADGGAIERGSYSEADRPIETGLDNKWVIDLKRLFASGVRKFGDVELVETAEEVIERGEVSPSRFGGWRPVISAVIGLLIGLPTGYLLFFAG